MIIRQRGADLLLIPQPDHAQLAARVIERWRADGLPDLPRRAAILAAVAEHDNGWREPDAAPIVNEADGTLLDFIHAPLAVRQGVWPRGSDRLNDTPYQAALVAEHSIQIFDRFHADAGWQPFFDDMRRRRDASLARARENYVTLSHDYLFLRIGDLVSLAFCNGWTGEQRFGPYTLRLHDAHVVIDPDPFDGREVPLEIAARRLPNRRYTPDTARVAFEDAPEERIEGRAAGH